MRFMANFISIIIPVYKETHTISRTLSHLLHLNPEGSTEIIVVDGSCDRDTLCCITDPRILKVASKKGRATQMNTGARHATGEVLLFLHADTLIPDEAFRLITDACQSADVVAGAFALGIDSEKKIYRIVEKAVALRTKLTAIPYGDQAIFVKRYFFHRIGGYREIPLMEDVELMSRIKAAGGKIALIPKMVRTSSRRWESEGFVCCTLRNWALISLYALGVPPETLVKLYRQVPSE